MLRRGRGALIWLLATVPLWLGCWVQLLRTNWDLLANGQYELALLGPITLLLLVLGATQWLVLRRYTTLAWLWIIPPFCALYLAFALSTMYLAFTLSTTIGFPFAPTVGVGEPLMLQEIRFGLILGTSYGVFTALVLKLILRAGAQPAAARVA